MPGLHVKVEYSRARISGLDDVAVTTHDWFKDDTDGEYTTAEQDAVIAALTTFFTGIADNMANNVVVDRYKLYLGYNGDGSPGEVDRTIDVNIPGMSASVMLPPQCACSVTEMTVQRPSWGRFYLPGFAAATVDDEGSYTAGVVTDVVSSAELLYESTKAANRGPVVWTKNPAPGGKIPLEVTEVRVDDLVDIIRSRRWRSPKTRITRVINI